MSTESVAASYRGLFAEPVLRSLVCIAGPVFSLHDDQGAQHASFGRKKDSAGAERARGYGARPTGRFSVELLDTEASA